MRGTVKQFKDALEEMKMIYPYEEKKTYLSTHNILECRNISSFLEVTTEDEITGIKITMAKDVAEDTGPFEVPLNNKEFESKG